jgi:hypothetical protein
VSDYPENYEEEYQEEYSDEYDQNEYQEEAEELNDSLEGVISSYSEDEISFDAIQLVAQNLYNRIEEIKNIEIPPAEEEVSNINLEIDRKRVQLEKVKNSSVFVNDLSEDVEFYYNDHHIKNVEDEIKELLNQRYNHEKVKFKLLEELEELEARYTVSHNIMESYNTRENIQQLADYSNEVIDDLNFYIDGYSSITEPEIEYIETWENNWNVLIEILGRCNVYRNKISEISNYFERVKKQLEDKDPETKFVYDELTHYEELNYLIEEVISSHESNLFTSISAIYELSANYSVGEDYLPENRVQATSKINKLKSIILSLKSNMDNYKLEYKDFRKSLNNIFVHLNKAYQLIENQQKILKNQQDARIKKARDIVTLISRSTFESLRNSTSEINNMINSLTNMGASSYQTEAIQYFFSLKAGYPVDESAREDIIAGLNYELATMNLMEIDLMTKILESKYDPRNGFYLESYETNIKPAISKAQTQKVSQDTSYASSPQSSSSNQTSNLPKSETKGKTGNLDFLGNMYLKEAQRSKGEWAAKSYLKAIETFMKCAELEDDVTKRITFLKMALKASKDAIVEKESSTTFHIHAVVYRELANNHTGKISPQAYIKIGDNFVNSAKMFLREEDLASAKEDFQSANDIYKIALPQEEAKLKIASIQKFLK